MRKWDTGAGGSRAGKRAAKKAGSLRGPPSAAAQGGLFNPSLPASEGIAARPCSRVPEFPGTGTGTQLLDKYPGSSASARVAAAGSSETLLPVPGTRTALGIQADRERRALRASGTANSAR